MDFLNRDFYKKLKFETETSDSEGKQCDLYRDGGSCVVHTIDTTIVFPYSYNTFGKSYQTFHKPYAGYKKYENIENERYLEMLELQRKEDERER